MTLRELVRKIMVKISTQDWLHNPLEHYPEATVACFDATRGELPRRQLDPERNARFLTALAKAGAPAVLIAASTGHGHLRTPAELLEWLECSAEVDLGDTVRMALARPEDGGNFNQALMTKLAEWNYACVFVRPGTDLSPDASDPQVAANMQPLVQQAAQAGLPVGVYSIPDVSGLPLTPAAVARLLEGPGGDHIVAVKVTEADYETSTRRFLESKPLAHLKIVQGWDPFLARALQDGPKADPTGRQRCGVTSGPMSLAVFQYLHILERARAEDWSEVELAQQSVTQLFQAMQDDPQKFADLQRAKYLMGLGHPLIGVITGAEVEKVLQALKDVPRAADRQRLAKSLDLLGDGPYHDLLAEMSGP